jgi:hypothetical protein
VLRSEWNALRADDKVVVHEPGRADLALIPGTVVLIDSRRQLNGVGIAVTAINSERGERGERKVLWPSFLVVHRDPRDEGDANESCWRCEALVKAAERTADGEPLAS